MGKKWESGGALVLTLSFCCVFFSQDNSSVEALQFVRNKPLVRTAIHDDHPGSALQSVCRNFSVGVDVMRRAVHGFNKNPPLFRRQSCPLSHQTQKFVFYSTQSSGTTWISQLLNSHPSINMWHEALKEIQRNDLPVEPALDTFYNSICALSNSFSCPNVSTATGFVMQQSLWKDHDLASYFRSQQVRVVVFERMNMLERAAGAKSTLKDHQQPIQEPRSESFDFERLAKKGFETHSSFLEAYSNFSMAGIPVMYVILEDVVAEYEFWVTKIVEFLGLKFQDMPKELQGYSGGTKKHRLTLEERLTEESLGEVKELLGMGMEKWLCMLENDCDWGAWKDESLWKTDTGANYSEIVNHEVARLHKKRKHQKKKMGK